MSPKHLNRAAISAVVLLGIVVLTAVAVAFLRPLWLLKDDATGDLRQQAFAVARDAAACLGVISVIVSVFQWVSQRTHETTRLAVEFMLDFYKDKDLEEVRAALRRATCLEEEVYGDSVWERKSLLRYDVVRVMNYFEAIAIAVQRKALDFDLVYSILGTPMYEVGQHPQMKKLVDPEHPEYSYEVLSRLLREKINPAKAKELAAGRSDAE